MPNYTKYSIGDKTTDGTIIEDILYRDEYMFVCISSDGYYKIYEAGDKDSDPKMQLINRNLQSSSRIINEIKRNSSNKFQGMHKRRSNIIAAQCIINASRCETEKDLEGSFSPLKEFIEKQPKVIKVFGDDAIYSIYQEDKDSIIFECISEKLEKAHIVIIGEYNRLYHIAKNTFSKSTLIEILSLLGKELDIAMQQASKGGNIKVFNSSNDFIEKQGKSIIRGKYLNSVGIMFIIMCLILYIYGYIDRTYMLFIPRNILLGCFGGVLGAFISVLQRSATFSFDPFVPAKYIIDQGAVRILLGAVFGGISMLAVDLNIIMGLGKDNAYALFMVAIAAGVSERMIPSVIEKIAEGKVKIDA